MIEIDGTSGEGGGQILRTALGLSLVTGRPFRIDRIRGGRRRPGLLHQHLTAVRAAATVGNARVDGAELGSARLVFEPGEVTPGAYRFSVGTAGSAGLVLQALLPALLTASGPTRVTLEGGTHNPWAPPFDFLQQAFAPVIASMGPVVSLELERPGFYPAGGGCFRVRVEPVGSLRPIEIGDRGALVDRRACALVAHLPEHIARRELDRVARSMGWSDEVFELRRCPQSRGPGNALMIVVASEHVTELFTAFGRRGVRAEQVADEAVAAARRYLEAEVPVGEHLADQLLPCLALAGGGGFVTLRPSRHTTTNTDVVRLFLDVEVSTVELGPDRYRISISRRASS